MIVQARAILGIDVEYADTEGTLLKENFEKFLDEYFGDEISLLSFKVVSETQGVPADCDHEWKVTQGEETECCGKCPEVRSHVRTVPREPLDLSEALGFDESD